MESKKRAWYMYKTHERAMQLSPQPDDQLLTEALMFYEMCFHPNWKDLLAQGCGDFSEFIISIYGQDKDFWRNAFDESCKRLSIYNNSVCVMEG